MVTRVPRILLSFVLAFGLVLPGWAEDMPQLGAERVARAFAWAARATGYRLPAALPPVFLATPAAVAASHVGLGSGRPARGRTIYGLGIVLADDLSDLSQLAVLVHEATHWLQQVNRASVCPGLREWQAHRVHAAFLAQYGRRMDLDWDRLRAAAERCHG
jgi:hypothetical protein